MPFDTQHNDAFAAMGALLPGQHWSAFDVSRDRAVRGEATLLVTSIWNYHSVVDQKGIRKPTVLAICRDVNSGEYWYRVSRPQIGTHRKTWVAHWNRIRLAIEQSIPIVGVLKDVATGNCSLENTFDCDRVKFQSDGTAIWLHLKPRATIGCPVRDVDIEQLTSETSNSTIEEYEKELQEAAQRTPAERRARLTRASKLPKTITVTSTVFVRNADVVIEALLRAEGNCEGCKQPAPFNRQSDGSPYLEVHHRIPLSIGGEDTLENVIALCPNCHRRSHYG